MIDEGPVRSRVREALNAVRRPAPGLVAGMRGAIASADEQPRPRWNPVLAGLAALALAIAGAGVVMWGRAAFVHPVPAVTSRPITAPGPLTDPAAQVAWVVASGGAVGVDPDGHIAQRVSGTFDLYLTYRSPDGKTLVAIDGADVRVYDAGTGALRSTIARPVAGVNQDAFSPDSRYLALLTGESPPRVQLLDLVGGTTSSIVTLAKKSDSPGFLMFDPDPAVPELFVFTDTRTAPRLSVIAYPQGQAHLDRNTVVGMGTCSDPAPYASKMLPDRSAIALFSHACGTLWLVDPHDMRLVAQLDTGQLNPFWFWPVFSPDGRFLYLHDTFSETVTRVDLEQRKVGPAVKPSAAPGFIDRIAGWFVTEAEAGGIGSTAPISPDGRFLYLPQKNGLLVLDTSTMLAVDRLEAGHDVHEAWVSGDGSRIYMLVDNGELVMSSSTRGAATLGLGGDRFLASTHG